MLTKTIDLKKNFPDLKGLLSIVADGTEVVFTEDNAPIARLIPISERIAGLHSGAIWISEAGRNRRRLLEQGYDHFR